MQSPALTESVVPPEPVDHSVCFYERDELLLANVAEFLDSALRAGGLAVAIATAPHCAELTRRLGGFGGPPERLSGWFSGRLVVLDAAATLDRFMVDGIPDARRFEATLGPVLAEGPAGLPLHAFGEMVALLCERGEDEAALRLEALWNALATRQRFSLYCAYPRGLFSSPERSQLWRHVCAAHGWVDMLAGEQAAEPPPAEGSGAHEDPAAELARLRRENRVLQARLERHKAAERTLRKREKSLAEFLDNACEGIHKVAADGTILYANRAELAMLGYRWEDYVGRNIAEFHVDQHGAVDILRRLAAGEVLRDCQAVMRCRDGTARPVLIHSSGCFEDGRLLYTRCFTRDGSERIELGQALQALERSGREREELLKSLREASRAKDEFLAMLGHELRNPLAPIVTALQLMRMRGDNGTGGEQAIIQRQVDHMVRLVDDLLDISRITRGKLQLQLERTEVSQVLAKAVEQASVLLEQRGHRLRIESEPGLACHCDAVRLAQVVANLLTNAARYTGAGGDVVLKAWRESPQALAISVRDNGSGIPPEILPRVFELFYQEPRGVDRAEGGLGIGLALVRSLVELHGGTVEARSDGVGRGSEFIVRLPFAGSADLEHRSPAPAPVPSGPGKRVLLVDDNQDGAETMAQLLRLHGHEVSVFVDPVSALAALADRRPQVAVLDIGLPVMDGYELGARIRDICGPGCVLVALTGYGQETDHARSRAAGFAYHLVKPITPQHVLEILDRVAGEQPQAPL